MTTIVYAGLALYVLTTALYLYRLFKSHALIEAWANRLLVLSLCVWLVLFAGLGLLEDWSVNVTQRWLWSSAWLLGVSFLFLKRRFPMDAAGSTIVGLGTVLACLGLFSKPIASTSVLESGTLLKAHIALAFIGVTAFGFAAAVSAVYLLQARSLKQNPLSTLERRLPPLVMTDKLSFRATLFGFPFYTIALLIGTVFAMRNNEMQISFSRRRPPLFWQATITLERLFHQKSLQTR